ncbi:MAG TPA: hypothetical protein VFA26_20290, partial [Gemmataceae bacterium]|nr:hypothetical protein [Gemmataceae bacterium]
MPSSPPHEQLSPAAAAHGPPPGADEVPSPRRSWLAAAALLAAALGLYAFAAARPFLLYDDFTILMHGWTWEVTRQSLWVPQNEHAMPLGRLTTWAACRLAGRPAHLPRVAARQGLVALLLGMGLVYLFVRRELGHSFYGLAAMGFFGVTTIYAQAVSWFAASFGLLALDTFLVALLAGQRWRQTRRRGWLALGALACALAPGWFGSGVLAGPLCAVYLLPDRGEGRAGGPARRLLPFAAGLAPLLGTAAFLAVCWPLAGRAILHADHFGNQTAVQALNPVVGLWHTARSLVDSLALGQLGVAAVRCPWWLVPLPLAALAAAAVWWWRQAPCRRLLALGLAIILCNYLLVFTARANWHYDDDRLSDPTWARYHLGPQLGLTLFLAGGLPRWAGRFGPLRAGSLTRKQLRIL